MKTRAVLATILCGLLLTAATPVSPIRADEAFWNMLTPAAREVLMQVPVSIETKCDQPRGVYHGVLNTIDLCAISLRGDPDRLRHEALHALDWSTGTRLSDVSGFVEAVPPKLAAQAERLYGGWFRPGELYAMVPIVVGWDFDRLPDDVAVFYAPWFEAAQ